MKIIKYFNKETVKYEKVKEKQKVMQYDYNTHKMGETVKEVEVEKPIYEIKPLEYPINDKECEEWYNIIKESYGEFGEVTVVDAGADTKTPEELQAEINAQLIRTNAKLQVDFKKQKELNAILLSKLARKGGK